jgi:serine/threonine protein kinase
VSDEPRSERSALSPELARELERVCDRFEGAWQGGAEPRFEDYLAADMPPALRPALLRELILLDIHHRRARGQSCSAATYRQRFPELGEEWLASALKTPLETTAIQTPISPEQLQGAGPGREPEPASTTAPTSESSGNWIGPYKLLQKLGEGGMGTVYVAQQERPVARRVALKIIKAGMDSAHVIARFEQERQALALMDHPNIAKVFDAGTTETGRPYFVMELVKGIPFTKFCDQEHLTPKERLELFIPICHAVQHAHQKGIIHRDLKPSNVLIALYDGRPVPKVIDFGVAKATGQKLTDQTMFTEVGQIVGTLEYMAPEQAELNNLDIDTRADIYSLGVLLYELLAGSPPFTRRQLRSAAFTEMLRLIREVEPPKPSTKVSSAENLPSLAALRKLEPKKLALMMRGDLDWIVMKCLEKERSRRYETANGLALEIQRYLADEPVLAGPPAASYRLRKFVKRNRGPVVAAALVLAALVAGMVGTTLGLIRADRALTAEAKQRGIAEANEKEAKAQKHRAIEFQNKALDALRATTDKDVEKLIGGKKQLGDNEKAYLEAIAKRWQLFATQEGNDEQAQALRGEGHYRVAFLWHKLGRRDEARKEFQRALDIRRKLVEEYPAVPEYQNSLAQAHNSLGNQFFEVGKPDAAFDEYRRALDIRKQLVAQFPDVADYQRDLAGTHNNLGLLHGTRGRRAEALTEYQQARDLQQKMVAKFPEVPEYHQYLAGTHINLGMLLRALGKRDEARGEYQQASDLEQKLVAKFPDVPEYQQYLARARTNMGNLLSDGFAKRDEALVEYEQARGIQQKLAARFPTLPDYQEELARTHNNLGSLLTSLGKRDEARGEYQQAIDIGKRLALQFPNVPGYQVDLGGGYCNLAILIRDEGKPAESVPWFAKAITTLTPVHKQDPRNVTAKQFLRNSYLERAMALDRLQRPAEAVQDWDMAIQLSPKSEEAEMRTARASSRARSGQAAAAVAEVEDLAKIGKWEAGQWYDLASVLAVASGKIADKKQQYADRAMELLRNAVQAGYQDGANMAKDADLDPLRTRNDFKKLLAELKAGKDLKK